MEDIFEHFGDIFGGGFSQGGDPFDFFGGSRGGARGRRRASRGSNLRIKVKLTLAEMAEGVTKKLKVKKQVSCDQCNGSGAEGASAKENCPECGGAGQVKRVTNTFLGQMYSTATCPKCQGEGTIIKNKCRKCGGSGTMPGEEILEIKIPAGVRDGVQLNVAGKGNAGPRGGINGDLVVVIEEIEDENLVRDGDNIIYELFLNFTEAALGSEAEVPTSNGKVRIKIPAGTQSGKIFRLKGKGIPRLNGVGKGDQLIHVNIWVPKSLSKDEKEMLQKLSKSPNFEPNPSKSEKNIFDRMKEMFT